MSVTNISGNGSNEFNFLTPLTVADQSKLEDLLSEIFKISKEAIKASSQDKVDDLQVYADLKVRLDRYNGTEVPEKILVKFKVAKAIVQSCLTFKYLCKESEDTISKANDLIQLINKKINDLKGSMNEPALQREKQRRLMGPIAMLLELRDKILVHDLREVQKYPELVKALEDIGSILDLVDPLDIQQARSLHGLHLEANLPVGFERVSETLVDLSRDFESVNVEFAQTEESDYFSINEKSGNLKRMAIDSHHHFIPLEETLIHGTKIHERIAIEAVNILNVAEMAFKIKDLVQKYADGTNYNSWPTLIKFIDHFLEMQKKNSSVTHISAYRQFDPDYKDVQEFGNACTGQSMAMLKLLKEKYDLQGYLVVQKEGPTGIPMHTAIVIPCRDGILLVETLNKNQPVIAIKSNQKLKVEMYGQESTLEIDSKSGQYVKLVKNAYEVMKDGTVRVFKTEFPLSELSTKAVMLKYLVDRSEFSFWNESTDYSIIINVHDGNIVFKRGQGRNAFRKTVPFSEINSVDSNSLLGQFCLKMNVPKEEARKMLHKIVDNHKIIKDLLIATRTPLPTH